VQKRERTALCGCGTRGGLRLLMSSGLSVIDIHDGQCTVEIVIMYSVRTTVKPMH
jgi:hypothetical protein